MRVSLFAVALPALVLAACSQPQSAPKSEPQPPPTRTLGGVDLTEPVRALGTEPGWVLNLNATEMVFEGMDRTMQQARRPEPLVHGTTATYTTATNTGYPMVLTLIATDCSDGMSDRTYPLVARLELGPETLTGCAASTAAITTAGESGRVESPPVAAPPAAASETNDTGH